MADQSIGLATPDRRTAGAITAGTSFDVMSIKAPVKQVKVKNTHASQTMTCVVVGADTEAAAIIACEAINTASAVTSGGAGFTIIAGEEMTLWKSSRSQYVAVGIVASGASTTGHLRGSVFIDR